ncbi:MAG: RagB/SusD family nutrient uptake outer membrane protein [Chitinophagaceae bacterium]|nr:MAG: RagB/SusD family nutrient uptake outer membrane protein [Chitinophagaceae bacterium]
MNKILQYKKLVLLIMFTALMASCKKDFLELVPKGKQVAQTVTDYDLLLNSLELLNVSTDAQVSMGDEVAAVNAYFEGAELRTQRLFKWSDVIYEPGQDAKEMDVPMKNIYRYNKIINEVMEASGGTEKKKRELRAEALAGRAWTYFLLINYYGKPYNGATAANDLGFPIVKKADVTETKLTRASVKEVYDFIIDDLTTAITDLPIQTTHRMRMSKAAAEGILGKVYVFMGQFDKALPLLNAAFTGFDNATIPVKLYNYNETFASGGAFMPVGMFGPRMPSAWLNQENVIAKQFLNFWSFTNNELVITKETADLYMPSDFRLNFYAPNAFFGNDYPAGLKRRIGPFSVGYGINVPDLLLLRAESKARMSDLEGAVNDVETLRKNRMPAIDAIVPIASKASKSSLVKFILDERIREFALQGYRWFDMRRLSVDQEFSATVKTNHQLFDDNGNVVATYTLKPERLVMQLPKKIIEENPGMENNP